MSEKCDIPCQLTLYGIHLLHLLESKIGGVGIRDIVTALHAIPKAKYNVLIYATAEDLKEGLKRMEEEGYIEVVGGKYRLTEKGERIAAEVAKANIGYMGYMRRIVEKSVKLYIRLELLILE